MTEPNLQNTTYSPKAAITAMLETLLQGVNGKHISVNRREISAAIELAYDENKHTVMNADSGQRMAEKVLDFLDIKKFEGESRGTPSYSVRIWSKRPKR